MANRAQEYDDDWDRCSNSSEDSDDSWTKLEAITISDNTNEGLVGDSTCFPCNEDSSRRVEDPQESSQVIPTDDQQRGRTEASLQTHEAKNSWKLKVYPQMSKTQECGPEHRECTHSQAFKRLAAHYPPGQLSDGEIQLMRRWNQGDSLLHPESQDRFIARSTRDYARSTGHRRTRTQKPDPLLLSQSPLAPHGTYDEPNFRPVMRPVMHSPWWYEDQYQCEPPMTMNEATKPVHPKEGPLPSWQTPRDF